MLVVSWTPNNPGRRFYGCPNYWVFQYLSIFLINHFFLLGSSSFVTVGGLLMLFCFIEMGFSSSSLFFGLEAIILGFLFSCFTKLFGGVKNGGELSCVDLSVSFLTVDVVTVS